MSVEQTDVLLVDELPGGSLDSSGSRRIVLDRPVSFGVSADADLGVLRRLRALTSQTVRVRWRLAGQPAVPLRDHVHLVPPADGIDQVSAALAGQWRAGYRYGACYYRIGPDFVTIKDVRPDGEQARMTIDGDGARLFGTLSGKQHLAELDAAELSALDTLIQLGLANRGEEDYLVLPYRMRHWPVPYTAV